ncbi:MAG: divalent metal cation transporter [bacterium]|nr:divalent metal cation transporter [bacterium]
MKRLLPILVGSVIAAAFLGPGTITTAARAGAAHGLGLLWALLFATVACLVLQEACARLTIASGHNLGEALRRRFHRGVGALLMLWLVLGAIVLGCAAYEAGNILGGVEGASLATGLSRPLLTTVSVALAGLLLWLGSIRVVVTILGALVAIMGGAFLLTGLLLKPPPGEVLSGLFVPSVPPDAGLLVLGLVGTTVVPYNLFLGSGIARGQRLGEARLGLAVAICLGGLISMAVMLVGNAVEGAFSYPEVGAVLASQLGAWAAWLFALGLFAAGFSSAVTAPLAAAITARSLFAAGPEDESWNERSWRYRSVWLGVLAVGAAFGLAEVSPVPAIIAAQALNGILLPVVAVFLWLVMNDRELLGDAVNGRRSNVVMGLVVAVAVVLGGRGVWLALNAILARL